VYFRREAASADKTDASLQPVLHSGSSEASGCNSSPETSNKLHYPAVSSMPKTKKTDLQVLRALLSLPDGKLSTREKQIFQAMYDNVATGMVIQLSKKQRLWTDSVYDRFDLDNPKTAPGTKPVAVRDKQLLKPR